VWFSFGRLGAHSDDNLAEIMTIEHPDECFGRFLQTVDDVLAITNAVISDAGTDLAQKRRAVLFGKFRS
jgi:hypothetical protein